jgi:putative peptidoglycan lipid II flippase
VPADALGSLARRALGVSAWTLLSRVLGLVRDRLWAGTMGGSLALDAFLAAFALPNLLRNLFGEGALTSALIPRYVQLRERDPAAAEVFAGTVLMRLALGLSLLSAVGMAIAALVIGVAWSHQALSAKALKFLLVAAMALPQIPYCIFICCCAVLSGVLNGRRHFWAPAAAPVVLNAVMISTIGLSHEDEAWLMPYAVLVAGMLQLGLLMCATRATGGIPPLGWRMTPQLAELRKAILPSLLATGAYQLNAYIDQLIAMELIAGTGAVAYLYFGNRLLQFPMALIGYGVTTVAYPELARRVAEGWAATGEGIRSAARLQAFWLLPAAVGLLATAEPLVRVIYQSGHFSAEGVERTVLVTRLLALSLVPVSLSKLYVRAFHAHRDQSTPMRVSLAMVALNLALNLVLVLATPLREAGLALATALSSFVGCVLYIVLLGRRGAGSVLPLAALARPIAASVAMGIAVMLLLRRWPQPPGHGSVMAAERLAGAVAVGLAVYLGIAGRGWWRPRRAAAAAGAPASDAAPPE